MLLRYDQGCSYQYELISLACVSSETHNLQGVFCFLRIYDTKGQNGPTRSWQRPWNLGIRIVLSNKRLLKSI